VSLLLSSVVVVVSACVAAGAESLEEVAAGRTVGLVVGELAQLAASAATLHEDAQMRTTKRERKNK